MDTSEEYIIKVVIMHPTVHFFFYFVYVIYLNIVSYLYGKQIKSRMGNKLYKRMIFICVRLNRLDLHDCHTMTLNASSRDVYYQTRLDRHTSDILLNIGRCLHKREFMLSTNLWHLYVHFFQNITTCIRNWNSLSENVKGVNSINGFKE